MDVILIGREERGKRSPENIVTEEIVAGEIVIDGT